MGAPGTPCPLVNPRQRVRETPGMDYYVSGLTVGSTTG